MVNDTSILQVGSKVNLRDAARYSIGKNLIYFWKGRYTLSKPKQILIATFGFTNALKLLGTSIN